MILLYSSLAFKEGNISDKDLYFLFWCGVMRYTQDLDSFLVQVIILVLLILERLCFRWTTDKFGCDLKKVEMFTEMNLRKQFFKKYEDLPNYEEIQHPNDKINVSLEEVELLIKKV